MERKTPTPKPKAPSREDRLKAALKANLSRRKSQAKARRDSDKGQDDATGSDKD